jgi:DNA-binding winged helix-turn-helix (wHTH) protein/tetratricopeptide (TPR) repeat protein
MAGVTFGPFRLDLETGELHRAGIAVKLQPQPARLLALLVQRAGELVTREEIRQRVWGSDTFVDFDQSVNFCVRQIRAVLHDQAATPCYLETVPRRGYRFIAPVLIDIDGGRAGPVSMPVDLSPPVRLRRTAITAAVVVMSLVALAAAAAAYRLRGTSDTASRHTSSAVHEEVALGRFFLNKLTADGTKQAIAHFEAAVKADPDCADAHAGMANAYNQLASVYLAVHRPSNVRLLALRAATRAVQLDPKSAEGYTALGYASMHEMDWARAEHALRRAIDVGPQYSPAHQTYASFLAVHKRFDEAIAEARRAVDLDPASLRARQIYGWMLYFDRRYDDALREFRTIGEMDPRYPFAHFRVGQVLIIMGRPAEAIPELETAIELSGGSPAAVGLLGMAYGASGRRTDAQRIARELEARATTENVPAGTLLLAYIGIDDRTRAVDMAARGYEERDNYVINIVADPLMDSLRSDSRFQEISRQVMVGSALDPSTLAGPDTRARR